MGLKLRESHPFKSVRAIGELELDDLTVIAGINGAGKTHLLQAIKDGAVRSYIDDELIDPADIVLYDWTNFTVVDAGEASLSVIRQRAEQEWTQIRNQLRGGPVQQLLNAARGTMGSIGTDAELLGGNIASLSTDPSIQSKIEELRRQCRDTLLNALNPNLRDRAVAVESHLGCFITEIRRAADYVDTVLLEAEPVSPLQQRISDLFVTYNSLKFDNDARRALAGEGEDLSYRDRDDFVPRLAHRPGIFSTIFSRTKA